MVMMQTAYLLYIPMLCIVCTTDNFLDRTKPTSLTQTQGDKNFTGLQIKWKTTYVYKLQHL